MLNRGFVYTYRVKTVRNTNVVVSISESKGHRYRTRVKLSSVLS